MSDYYIQVDVSRDTMVEEVGGNIEQAPYVLAGVAERIRPGTTTFDDFCDALQELDGEGKAALQNFCQRISDNLST
ncbi:hypothetical protein PhaeoP66_04641 (plasmid) [Phaeobacter inhibens]|uniref:Uncharacterized protein n=1 Tax=Phaeobacter inhibens TaxID=221822 RepID=A0ABM6RBS3_9RHOB|nr:hypothetical protein [Phaeobacter inhibens]AUQ93835.1 hypothetical protein PhaeoP66_01031 [Phaeobacter inhibens]AUQ97367.1 hypothetical protein PhaeoP66_04641 [Phaeobacter inhibens]